MKRPSRAFSRLFVGDVLAVGLLAITTGQAAAKGKNTCTGSANNFPSEAGVLSGTYSGNVDISGVCGTVAGPTTVNGNLTVEPGSALFAAFASSPVTVKGNIIVKSGGTLILGCFATSFSCFDDPSQGQPTLNGPAVVGGSIISSGAL